MALLRRDQALGMAFVRETYRAFWCEGKDISDPAVLRQLVEQVGGSPEDVGTINGEDRRSDSRMGSGLALNRPGRGSPDGLVGGRSPCRLRTFRRYPAVLRQTELGDVQIHHVVLQFPSLFIFPAL